MILASVIHNPALPVLSQKQYLFSAPEIIPEGTLVICETKNGDSLGIVVMCTEVGEGGAKWLMSMFHVTEIRPIVGKYKPELFEHKMSVKKATDKSSEFCYHYCKYPDQYDNEYKMLEERCKDCPITSLEE